MMSYAAIKKLYRAVLFGLICYFSFPTSSLAQDKILAVVSHQTDFYDDFYQELISKLDDIQHIEKSYIQELTNHNLGNYNKVIAIGSDASEILSRSAKINHVIYTLIPSSLSNTIDKRTCLAKKCQSVLIEQPEERYFQLFKGIFPQNRTLVIASTAHHNYNTEYHARLARKYNITFKNIFIDRNKVIARELISNLNKRDVLLALPNPDIYNRNTAKSIILSAYHKSVPIIAYSQSFANAGALVSLYSSFENIAAKTASLITEEQAGNNKNYHPDEFSLEYNSSVARSLSIDLNNIEHIKSTIK